ncbi:Glycerol-3-phosphate acyltransferase [Gammaproteobacteria bacterium]
MLFALLVPFAYLLGSLSTAILLSKQMGLPDPRTQGSGNPGATNVLRLGNRKAAAITLLGDSLKGLLPVLLARAVESPTEIIAITGLAAFLGHLYPIFFKFRGGKGVATSLGVLLGFSPWLGLGAAATWLGVYFTTRISSASALIVSVLVPLYALKLTPDPISIAVLVMSGLLLWRHRSNLQRLIQRKEV